MLSWERFEWMDFSHPTRTTPQSIALAMVEDFDEVRAEKTPQQGVRAFGKHALSAIV